MSKKAGRIMHQK